MGRKNDFPPLKNKKIKNKKTTYKKKKINTIYKKKFNTTYTRSSNKTLNDKNKTLKLQQPSHLVQLN
jgi:hypothetical protein